MTETAADPRAKEKRRRIIEAAWRLALRSGLRATTMEALAREAGVAKGTLYAHFPDKDAVFDGVIADLMVELAAAFDRGMRSDGGDRRADWRGARRQIRRHRARDRRLAARRRDS